MSLLYDQIISKQIILLINMIQFLISGNMIYQLEIELSIRF